MRVPVPTPRLVEPSVCGRTRRMGSFARLFARGRPDRDRIRPDRSGSPGADHRPRPDRPAAVGGHGCTPRPRWTGRRQRQLDLCGRRGRRDAHHAARLRPRDGRRRPLDRDPRRRVVLRGHEAHPQRSVRWDRATAASWASAERADYERALRENADSLAGRLGRRDLLVLHDPQTAGLIPLLRERVGRVVWRCHVGLDRPSVVGRPRLGVPSTLRRAGRRVRLLAPRVRAGLDRSPPARRRAAVDRPVHAEERGAPRRRRPGHARDERRARHGRHPAPSGRARRRARRADPRRHRP